MAEPAAITNPFRGSAPGPAVYDLTGPKGPRTKAVEHCEGEVLAAPGAPITAFRACNRRRAAH